MKTNKLSIKMAITATAGIAIFISIIYVAYLSNKEFEETVVSQTQQELLTIAKAIAKSMEEFFIEHSNALVTVSNYPILKKGAYEKHRCYKPACEFCPIINLYEVYKNDVDALTFLDANGIMLHMEPFVEDRLGINYSDKPGIAYVLREHKPHISEVFYNDFGNLALSISRPIFHKDKFAGIIRWMIETDTISKRFVKPVKIGNKGFVWMFDNKETVISHPRKDFIGMIVSDIIKKMHKEGCEIIDESRIKEHSIEEYDYLNRVMAEEEGSGLLINWLNNEQDIFSYKRVLAGNTTFNLIATLPYSEIISPINKHAKEIFGLAGFVIILLGAGGVILLRSQKEKAKLETEARYLQQISDGAEALRKSEMRLRSIFDAAENVSLVMTDLADTGAGILEFSRGAELMFGYSRDEAIGKPVAMLHLPEDVAKFPAFIESMRQRKEGFAGESTLVRKSGEKFPALFTTHPIFDSEDNMTATIGVSLDITKRKQAEDALKESEERYRAVFEGTAEGIIVADIETQKFKYANPATCRMLGYSEEELKQMSVFDIHPKEAMARVIYEFESQAKGEKTLATDMPCLRKDGTTIYTNINLANVLIDGRECNLCLFTDITDQKMAEKQIRLLSQQLIRAHEIERQMISRELHDSVAQDLSAIKIGCDTIIDDYPEVSARIRQMVVEFSKILQNSIMAVRDMAYDLRPPGLDQLHIIETIFQYCKDFSEKTGLNVDFSSAGMEDIKLDSDMKINLYRLVQEGLINIRKHAEATNVTIRLVAAFPNIILRIKDDGKGFDVKSRLITAQNEKRMGLWSMGERVGLLGGEMHIESRPEEGTNIVINFPYKNIDNE